jgi:TonB family protein
MKRLLAPLGLLLAGAAGLHAQTALYVEHDHEFCLVRSVSGHDPYIDNGKGKLIHVNGRDYALRQVPEYAPVYVAIRNLKVGTQALQFVESGNVVNQEFDFRAEFESQYTLNNVYLVLELSSKDTGNALFVQEVGHLAARKPKPVHVRATLKQALGPGGYKLHLYSEGTELFHSGMDFAMVEHVLDDMVRRRVTKITDADPQPFTGPAPEYPAKLRRAKVKGRAVIGFTISPTGRVLDPKVVSATAPEFGDAALVAARMWRFLPLVQKGHAVATPAEMPFAFDPGE